MSKIRVKSWASRMRRVPDLQEGGECPVDARAGAEGKRTPLDDPARKVGRGQATAKPRASIFKGVQSSWPELIIAKTRGETFGSQAFPGRMRFEERSERVTGGRYKARKKARKSRGATKGGN
ncbi:hypothetical protein KM043_004823 [Ampulex compressa]|nr:hypothetical protein KM043_004823 [Ampulex compressa]